MKKLKENRGLSPEKKTAIASAAPTLSPAQLKANEAKRKAKEQAVAAALLNTALDRLNELAAPYCLLIGDLIMSNQTEPQARATVCDMANLLSAIQEKRVELQADRIVYGLRDDGEGDTKQA